MLKKNKNKKAESVAICDDANQIQMTPGGVYTMLKHFTDRNVDTGKRDCLSAVWPIMVL